MLAQRVSHGRAIVQTGQTTGQGNLDITTRDEAAIGQLVLNDGVVSGRRILTHYWISKGLASQIPISDSDPFADFYGYMWYTKAEPVGNRKMIVAIASSAYGRGYGQRARRTFC